MTWQLNWLRNFFGIIRIFLFSISDTRKFQTAKKEIEEIEDLLG